MSPSNRDGDLQFLLVPLPSERGWTFKKAKRMIRLLKTRKKLDIIAKEVGFSVCGVSIFLQELKRAAKKKYTLKKYFELNRPLRTGKKIID